MTVVQRTRVVNARIAPTWAAVSRMGAVQDWHPNVASAVVLTAHDTGIGASRRVEFQDGNSAVETVVEETSLAPGASPASPSRPSARPTTPSIGRASVTTA